MIGELFVPKKLFGRRLIAETTVGIALEHDHVTAALVHKTTKGNTLQELVTQALPATDEPYAQRAAVALKTLYSRLPPHDNVAGLIPASQVTFRELTLPLTSVDKIRLVIELELEEQLPFSLEDAVVDFIITEQTRKESTVFAAAVQKADIAQTLDIFRAAGIEPTRISIDILALYDVFLQIEQYASLQGGVALVDACAQTTRIGFIESGKLRAVRTIATTENLASDVQFTLQAFMHKLEFYGELNTILLSGNTSQQANIEKTMHTKTLVFDVRKLMPEADGTIPLACASIGAALPAPQNEHFDLRRDDFSLGDTALQRKQVVAALGMLCALVLIVLGGGVLQIRRLRAHASSIEGREVAKLQRLLSKAARETVNPSLSQMIKRAQRAKKLGPLLGQMKTITASEEETWGALRARALPAREALLSVTGLIDREAFRVRVNTLALSSGEEASINIEVNGVLSPKQMGEEYTEYAKFEQALGEDETTTLTLVDSSPGQIDEKQGGLAFSVTLRKKGEELV